MSGEVPTLCTLGMGTQPVSTSNFQWSNASLMGHCNPYVHPGEDDRRITA